MQPMQLADGAGPINPASTVRKFEADWAHACARWLPLEAEGSPWRFNRNSQEALPSQGWKLHVSATILGAVPALEAVAPLLYRRGVLFKGPKSLAELKKLNCGLFYGFSQVGKFLTVYPRDDEEACALARELDSVTRTFDSPRVPFEQSVAEGSSVFTRYGAFGPAGDQGDASLIRTPAGDLVPDERERNPPWAKEPPTLIRRCTCRRGGRGLLATRFRAWECLSQRGKGGVYRALDLEPRPARLCALKEGRAHGEVDWDGRDGRIRVRQEADFLREFQDTPVPVPRIYGDFEEEGNFYVAIEWIEGTSLAALLAPGAPLLRVEEAVLIAHECASIVAEIHKRDWVWRDLKAANLIRGADGRLRPIDFEGAERAGSPAVSAWGTIGYLPPEWLEAECVSFAQDCYALGVVLHQLFTNAVPRANEPLPLIESLRSDVPGLIGQLVAELTDISPQMRISAARAAQRLEPILPR